LVFIHRRPLLPTLVGLATAAAIVLVALAWR
jgi:hypothetical protein